METKNQQVYRQASGKSDRVIVPVKQANKTGKPAAEPVEERTLIKRNIHTVTCVQTQSWINTTLKLKSVREIAKGDKNAQFTSIMHLITEDLLKVSFYSLEKKAAEGSDEMSWYEFERNLNENIHVLFEEIHNGSYRPQPAKRIYIPKADGTERPISIQCMRDKVIQQAMVYLLEQIYEEDFLGFSYGFRPNRSQHDALDSLSVGISRRKINWVLDLDIRKFFDRVDHDWLIKFIQHRIRDKRVIRLIIKWLKVGYLDEKGKRIRSFIGTPQGSVISPLLSNIYLHYVYDLWCSQWRAKNCKSDMIIIRYADDSVVAFQFSDVAKRFLSDLKERMKKFGLELHEDKTRLIRFGRNARRDCKYLGLGKPKTFDFLGFTHFCGTTRAGRFVIWRKTIRKRMIAKLKELRRELLYRRHKPIKENAAWLSSIIRGHMYYYSVPGNINSICLFIEELKKAWFRSLCMRSQKGKITWMKFNIYYNPLLPKAKVMHPYPSRRFDVKYSR